MKKSVFNWIILVGASLIFLLMLIPTTLSLFQGEFRSVLVNGIWLVVAGIAIRYELRKIRNNP